jgi:hypothetical protein
MHYLHTAVGYNAMVANTTGSANVAMGNAALDANTDGSGNTAIGGAAMSKSTTASNCTAVGRSAAYNLTTGDSNTAVGRRALYTHTTGTDNVAMGYQALYTNATGNDNVAIGKDAGYNCTSSQNVFVGGEGCGDSVTTGSECVFMGPFTGTAVTTANGNTLIGSSAGNNITTGEYNTFVGKDTGAGSSPTTTADNCVFIGINAGKDQGNNDNQLYIARNGVGPGNAAAWIVGASNGAVYQGNNSSSWSTTSDRRLKKNIVNNTKGLAEVNQLRVTNFEYKNEEEIDMSEFPLADNAGQVVLGEGNEGLHIGVIAQEVEAVLPECIEVSVNGAKTVQTDPIMWAMVNAIKELSAKVETLESKLNN